jgi:hypothetical protein
MEIKELYAMCYQKCDDIDSDDVRDLMADIATLLMSPTIGEMNENTKQVAGQLIQEFGQRIYRVRSGQDWKTGDVL